MTNAPLTARLLTCVFFLSIISKTNSQELEIGKTKLERDFASLINRQDTCEAYPFLSADGLRLYFTGDWEGAFGRIYFCTRNSVNENFSKPKPLSANITDGYFCSTLTGDELTMYIAKQGEIYVSKRKSLSSEFTKPERVTGLVGGWKFAPAISPDGNELILLKDSFHNKDVTYVYKKINDKEFVETGTMSHPLGLLTPGQFSKDGLSYYTSYERFDSKIDTSIAETLVKYTRQALGDKFETIEELPPAANPGKRNHQPTVNGDGTILIIVNTRINDWRHNDLNMINLDKKIVQDVVIVKDCEMPDEELEIIKVDTITIQETMPGNAIVCERIFYEEICELLPLPDCQIAVEEIIFCDGFSCGGTVEIIVNESDLPEPLFQVKVYPNPFVNNLNVTINEKAINSILELYDISGRKMLTAKLNSRVNNIQFNKPGTGAYFYNIRAVNGEIMSTGKLIKR